MNKMEIIIFSLEGEKSNTELNFFTGMNDFLENDHKWINEIYAYGFDPTNRKKHNGKEKIKNKLKNDLLKMKMDKKIENNINIMIFFIGDGDVEETIDAMEHSKEILINEINDYYPNNKFFKIENKILFAKNGFEKLLKIRHMKCTKKRGNVHLFKNIAEEKKWYADDVKIDWNKVYNFFKNTNYEVLFCLFIKNI